MSDFAHAFRSYGKPVTALIRTPIAITVGLVAMIVASAYVSVPLPVGPVPMTMQSLAVLMAGVWAGPVVGMAAVAAYLGLALAGLPVLAGGVAAPGLLLIAKPTFGFLVGFLAGAGLAGCVVRRLGRGIFPALLALILGHAVIFLAGYLHLLLFMSSTQALAVGVLPFIPGTVVKTLLGAALVAAGRGLRHGV